MLIPISFLRKAVLSPEDKLTFNIVQAEVQESNRIEAEKLEKRVLEELSRDTQGEQLCADAAAEDTAKKARVNIWTRKRPGDKNPH